MEQKMVKALYTLSNGEGIIHISKGRSYIIYFDGKNKYIINNIGEKMHLNDRTIKERFE